MRLGFRRALGLAMDPSRWIHKPQDNTYIKFRKYRMLGVDDIKFLPIQGNLSGMSNYTLGKESGNVKIKRARYTPKLKIEAVRLT